MKHVVLTLIQNGTDFAMLKRKNGHMTFPGGKIEEGETIAEAAIRETAEEAGLEIDILDVLETQTVGDYFLVYVHAVYRSGALRVMEPENFDEAGWIDCADIIKMAQHWPNQPARTLDMLEALENAKNIAPRPSGLNFG